MMTTAKGLTIGAIPMGAVLTTLAVHDAFMPGPEHMIELFHGCTYSGNRIAAACGIATLETCREEGLFDRARDLEGYWQDAIHSLKGLPHVIEIRNMGLIGAFSAFLKAYEKGIMISTTGDLSAMSPPLIISKARIDQLIGTLGEVLKTLA